MCTSSDPTHGSAPASVADALRLTGAGLDYLNSAAASELMASALGDALRSLGGAAGQVHRRACRDLAPVRRR